MNFKAALSRRTLSLSLTIAGLAGAVVFGMVLAGGLDLTVDAFGATQEEQEMPSFSDPVAENATSQVASFADLAEAVLPAVVTVRSTAVQQMPAGLDIFPFGPRRSPGGDDEREFERQGVGSGFLISPDGWLVTNHHVIDGATDVQVILDGETVDAEIKGSDPSTDIAVLKIEGEDHPHLPIGDSEELRVGDWVMAVGSPLGFGSSVTVGVVSAKGRVLGITGDNAFDDFIQTDAAINRGNSGGPLVNTRGEVVGVSTAMNYGAENIGFAVSSKILTDVVPQLRGEGRVARGYLGVSIRDLEADDTRAFGLDSTDGALITGIQARPAREAGLEPGDVVVAVDGRNIENVDQLIDRISSLKPGEKVELGIVRDRDDMTRTVTLGDRSENLSGTPAPMGEDSEDPAPTSLDWLEVEVETLTEQWQARLRLEEEMDGVVLTEVGRESPLSDKGVMDYDIVREVNGESVASAAEFARAVGEIESGEPLLLFIYSPQRGGFQDFVVVEVP